MYDGECTDVHLTSEYFGASPLSMAGKNAISDEIFSALIDRADRNRMNELNRHGKAPIHYLCGSSPSFGPDEFACFKKRLELLLRSGADINLLDASQNSPLDCSVQASSTEAVEILLQNNADPRSC